MLKQVRRGEVEAEGGDQGASDCRPPRGIHLQGNSGLEQLHRRGNTLNPFLGYLLSFNIFCPLIVQDFLPFTIFPGENITQYDIVCLKIFFVFTGFLSQQVVVNMSANLLSPNIC